MSALRQALADYLAVRRALGFKLYRAERLLGQFVTFVEDRGEERLTTETALAWATLPSARSKLGVRPTFRCSPLRPTPPRDRPCDRGAADGYAVPSSRPSHTVPLLATDISTLMSPTGTCGGRTRVATFRTLIALLAATGMRVGEAIGLDSDDFDAINGLLTIRNGKFGKFRELPLHPSTVAALQDYLRRDDRPTISADTSALLVSTVGTGSTTWVSARHSSNCRRAGLKPRSAACRPRLHDLRHGFAVNTILDGYRDGREPGNRIALLSTYLGHVDPVSTYWYLSAAPELLTLVGDRLERHLGGAA